MNIALLLFAIFTTLKLTHLIHWPWLWVTSPLWISAALALGVFALFALGLTTTAWLTLKPHRRRQ